MAGRLASKGVRTALLLLAFVLVITCASVLMAHHRSPPAEALARHLGRPADDEAFYPRLASTLRGRAWILYGPSQPSGVALFTDLPDVVFAPGRTIRRQDIHAAIAAVHDREFDARQQAWVRSGAEPVPVLRVRSMLEAACPTPDDARFVLDLLLGRPGNGAPDFAAMLRAGTLPEVIRIAPFAGDRGILQRDVGLPPYRPAVRPYRGILAAFDGPGWPSGWRVGSLRAVGY